MIKSYREAGVDIEAGDDFVSYIRSLDSPAIGNNPASFPGGFASGFEIDTSQYRNPVILSSTDGVGTKLLVARALGAYETLGIDLVAMCVNDLIVHGAKPIQFLDYIACARIDRTLLDPVVRGIVRGCEIAGCELAGGETAELPDLYEPGGFDLAGFALGVAEKTELLPKSGGVFENAAIYGLASSGIHSNGLSLARKVIPETDRDSYSMLLEPTRIYVDELAALTRSKTIIAAAHITGGGLIGNISRLLPDHVHAELTFDWPRPEIFDRIQNAGDISEDEMRRVYNIGIGMALIVESSKCSDFEQTAKDAGINAKRIGTILDG